MRAKPRHALAVWTVLSLPLAGTIDLSAAHNALIDAHRYEAMRAAAPLLAEVRQPECYRLAGPWLAALMGWQTLSWLALVAVTWLLYRYLRVETSERAAALACALFVASHSLWVFFAFNPYQANDVLALGGLIVALHALRDRRWPVFAAAVAIGCLARESALLALPVAIVANWRSWPWCLPGLVVFVGVRIGIEPAGGLDLAQAFLHFAPLKASPAKLVRYGHAIAPAIGLALWSWRRLRRAHVTLIVATLVSSLFGLDAQRLMLPMAPVLALLVAMTAEQLTPRRSWVVLALGALAVPHHIFGLWQVPRCFALCAVVGSTVAMAWIGGSAWRGARGIRDSP